MPLHTKLITSKVSQLFIPSLNTEVHTSKVNTKLLRSLKSLFVIPNKFKVFLNLLCLYFVGREAKRIHLKKERERKSLYNSCDKTFILASST